MSKTKGSSELHTNTNDIIKFSMCLRLLVKYGEKLSSKDFDNVSQLFYTLLNTEMLTTKELYYNKNKETINRERRELTKQRGNK